MPFGEKERDPVVETRISAILDVVSDAVLATDDRAIILYANRSATRLLGYETEELLGKSVKMLLPEDASRCHDGHLNDFRDRGYTDLIGVPRDLVMRRKSGEEVRVLMVLDPLPSEGERRFVASLRDLSALDESRTLANERAKLAFSEERFRDFAECGADWFWEIDADYRFTYMSPQVEAATGYTPEWHLGHTREELGLDQENAELMQELYQEVDGHNDFQDRIQVRRKKDGGHVWIAFSGKPIEDDRGNFLGYRGVSRDVTAAVVREKDLRATNAELENFAYVASHDLQEPLRKIMAFGEMLTAELGNDLDPMPAMYLSRMSAASGRMRVLISNLLEFSRAGRPQDPAEPVDLNAVAQQVLTDQEETIRDAEASVHFDDLPVVTGHESQFYQLLGNLLGNALKFRKPDTPAKVEVLTRLTNAWLEIEFRDHGIGFDDGQAERIFELFGRLHGRSKYEGTGLGLAICRKIVEFHDGRLIAKGTPGKGASFTVRLPRELVLRVEYQDERVA